MGLRLIAKDFLTYGARVVRGKVAAGFLLLAELVRAAPVWAEPVTVLALGDSLTQGYGLVEAEGFVPQMQGWLRNQGIDVLLINGGVSGESTAGGAARVAWSLTPGVDAMIVALGGNDLLRGIDPAVSRENLAMILDVAKAAEIEVLLVGLTAPGNYGPDYKADFEAIYPELAMAYGTLYFEDFFAGLGADNLHDARGFFQPDGIHPNAAGVVRIVAAMGPAVARLIAASK